METKLVERRMYEKKAQKIIERLSEETVKESTLVSLARFIEPYHYEEIVEERFLSKLCGYPICCNELTNIPTQKYRISTLSNKVYDITDRKRFCSGDCFKASKYFSTKISTVPIWSRNNNDEHENVTIPEKKVQVINQNINNDSHGTELISQSNLYSNEIEKELNSIEQEWKTKMKLVEKKLKKKPKKEKKLLVEYEITEHLLNKDQSDDNEEVKKEKEGQYVEINKTFFERADQTKKILDEFMHLDKSKYFLAKIFPENNIDETFKDKAQLIEYLIRRLDDLLAFEAKNYIKNEKNESEKVQFERERIEFNQKYLNYQSKSEIQNLDSDDDPDESQEEKVNDSNKKPLPYYDQLKKEAFVQQLKIKEFFKPSLIIDDNEIENDNNKKNAYEKPIILPEIDSLSQNQIRQRIFFEKIFKNIESLLKYSNFKYKVINIDLKNHVKNFISVLNLTNENLIFKSNEWPIISIIALEMLSWKFKTLQSVLSEDRFIKTLLNALNLDYDKLKRISNYLINT